MKHTELSLTAGLLLSLTLTATATTLYVDVNNPAPAAPYTNWVTAATNIQDAVDASTAGDEIVVADGVYQTGGRLASGTSTTNRVVVDKAVIVQSVNGPAVTVILGNALGSVRCVYLTNGAVLAGFTLTNGTASASDGGGVWCASQSAMVSNCVLVGNSAYNSGGGAYSGTLNNCTLSGNSANYGAGAYSSTLNNCTLSSNRAANGGGANSCTLNNCALSGNSASGVGGGIGGDGGGAYNSTLNNCTLTGNSTTFSGVNGGGRGNGSFGSTLNNCIVYYNSPPGGNYFDCTFNYCCTTPLPGGIHNTNVEPALASLSHVSAGSPCRGAGNAAYASGVDIDGEPWANPPSIGCDEYWSGSVTGAVSAAIIASYTNVPVGFSVDFQAVIGGRLSASSWDFGDGLVVSNRPYASHAWAAAGDYTAVLRAYNESYPDGVVASVTVHVVREHFVALSNSSPVWPYSSWTTAATNIQDAVDAAGSGAVVLVSNGVYQTGARAVNSMSNRVAVTKPVTVQSVNGPDVTIISGYQWTGPMAVRCVYLTNGAVLAGFTLTNGGTRTSGDSSKQQAGGGVWCEAGSAVVSNCVLAGNYAVNGGGALGGMLYNCTLRTNSAFYGGAANASTLNNCTLTANTALYGGGGAEGSTLINCTLTSNSVSSTYLGGGFGGGASYCTLSNCVLGGNRAVAGGGGTYYGTLNNCLLRGNTAATYGGGACFGTLSNCLLTGNAATNLGGGSYAGTLYNCTLSGNSAASGGGAYGSSTLNNCVVYYNTAPDGNYKYGTWNYCCTTPLPGYGTGSFTNAPLFVDQAGANLRLQSNSPCINAGLNASAPGATDLDGNPRIVGGTVDVGAYECQAPALLDYYSWLQSYGLPTAASAVYADSDGDGLNNWQEWLAGTNPTNAASALLLQQTMVLPGGVTLTWPSVTNRAYFVQRATSMMPPPAFSLLQSNIPGLPGTTSFTDTNPPASGPAFYRVGVQP
jgi:hypothetical protein